jgi:hypothetical protein
MLGHLKFLFYFIMGVACVNPTSRLFMHPEGRNSPISILYILSRVFYHWHTTIGTAHRADPKTDSLRIKSPVGVVPDSTEPGCYARRVVMVPRLAWMHHWFSYTLCGKGKKNQVNEKEL